MLIFPKYQFYLWIFHTENDLSSVQVLGITLLDQQCLQPFSHWCVSICQALVWVNCKKLALLNSIIHWDCPDFHHHRATTRWVAMKACKLANYLTVSQNWICCCKTKPTMTWTYTCQTFKLLSRGIHYDYCKTSISTYQKKALSEPHWALPLSCCTFTACGSDVHVLNFPIQILMNKMWRHSANTRGKAK